jgi:UDPglucose--hexose-1-phosphate uridylyltransferase
MSEIRYSKLDDRYVIIAPERFHKPHEAQQDSLQSERCPFCKQNDHLLTKEIFSLQNKNGVTATRVVPNLYTAVNLDCCKPDSKREGMFEKMNGFGVHEIIIDTVEHKKTIEFDSQDYFYLLQTIKIRILDLKKDMRIKYLSIFKNSGIKAGASQSHPHTQIIGLPIIPITKRELFARQLAYYKEHGRALLRDIVDEEITQKKRVLLKNQYFIAFLPYASLYAFEVMIVPNENISSLVLLDEDRLRSLAAILQKSIELLAFELGDFDFNIEFFEQPINKNFDSEDFFDVLEHINLFAVRIYPRLFNLAGFEISQNMHINSVEPEFAAKVLHESLH